MQYPHNINSPKTRWLSCCRVMALLAMLFLSCSCESREDLEAKVTREYHTGEFLTVDILNVFDVYLVQDTAWSLTVKGHPKAMEHMKITTEGGRLILDRARKTEYLYPRRGNPEVYIHFDSLQRINVFDACHIRSLNALTGRELGIVDNSKMMEADLELDMRTFYFWNIPNGSRMSLRGKVKELKMWNFGLASVDASALQSEYVLATNESQGDCRVRAAELLEYSLRNIGNIIYFGNTTEFLELPAKGSGKLIKGD